MNENILRELIREMLEEEVGQVTVTRGSRSPSIGQRAASAVGNFFFGDADESTTDEEILDETDEDEEALDEDGAVITGSGTACEDDCGGGSTSWNPFN